MSATVDEYDDYEDTEDYDAKFDETYDEIDDLLYRAFLMRDVDRLNGELNEEQRLLLKNILGRTEKVIAGRARLAFKRGVAQGRRQVSEKGTS